MDNSNAAKVSREHAAGVCSDSGYTLDYIASTPLAIAGGSQRRQLESEARLRKEAVERPSPRRGHRTVAAAVDAVGSASAGIGVDMPPCWTGGDSTRMSGTFGLVK